MKKFKKIVFYPHGAEFTREIEMETGENQIELTAGESLVYASNENIISLSIDNVKDEDDETSFQDKTRLMYLKTIKKSIAYNGDINEDKSQKLMEVCEEIIGIEKRLAKAAAVKTMLNVTASKSFKLNITTFTPRASFTPTYRVDVAETLKLSLIAKLVNNTGEELKGNIDLSTAKTDFSVVPNFYPETIGNEVRLMNARCMSDSSSRESMTSRDFVLGNVALSDKSAKVVQLEHYELPAKISRKCFLFSGENVLIVASCELPSLISAPADVYVEGKLIGRTSLEGGEISLGIDNTISVKKKFAVPVITEFLGETVTENGYSITIKNNKYAPTKLQIIDRIPHSVTSEISVKENNLDGGKLTENGKVTFDVDLPPNEQKTLTVSYLINKKKHPQN